MRHALRQILERKRAYARLPLFELMRDGARDPLDRIAFYPCLAPFVMSFGDLNRHLLRYASPADEEQRMINEHTYEDDHHWPWYLEDLRKLGFDAEARGSEWMAFLWGEENTAGRLLVYGITGAIEGTSGLERLAIIEAIEEAGNVFFSALLPIARALEQRLGVELRYCGAFHFEREQGHVIGADHAALAAKVLDAEAGARVRARVDRVFDLFSAWSHELLRYALAHPATGRGAGSGPGSWVG